MGKWQHLLYALPVSKLSRSRRYKFQPGLLGEAHSENQRKVGRAVARGVRMIVVDNTNTMAWEMKPYISLAVNNGYKVSSK